MRALLPIALTFSLLAAVPSVSAALPPDAGCDVDDDLYNHCHVGPVHWVTGPGCAGVRVGGEAGCRDLVTLALPDAGCDVDDDLYNHCHVGSVHWVTGPGCVGVRVGGTAPCKPILVAEAGYLLA